jgi:hypothetical protein
MHCPNCGSQNIRLRHVGKKTGGVIGATAGGIAGLEGASTGALIGSVIPVVGTIAGGLIGFLSGACAGAVAGSLAGEQLDGTVFDEYGCTQAAYLQCTVTLIRVSPSCTKPEPLTVLATARLMTGRVSMLSSFQLPGTNPLLILLFTER